VDVPGRVLVASLRRLGKLEEQRLIGDVGRRRVVEGLRRGVRQANALAVEFPVKKYAVLGNELLVVATGAVKRVVTKLLALATSPLQGAAFRANREARARLFDPRNNHWHAVGLALTEVDFAEGNAIEKLKGKRKFRPFDGEGLAHRVGRTIHQRLPNEEQALPLVRIIGDPR
jgi:hypothetical protein